MKRRRANRRGFSDRLYFANLTLTWFFVLACFILNAFSAELGITDLAIINVGIPAAFVELGLHTKWIVNKAKVENLAKHKKLNDASVNID